MGRAWRDMGPDERAYYGTEAEYETAVAQWEAEQVQLARQALAALPELDEGVVLGWDD